MPITDEEKQYIIEEETLRFETKKRLMREEFGGWGRHRHGCHGRHFWGSGIMRILVLALAVFGLARLFHGAGCGWSHSYNDRPMPQSAPVVPPASKN